MEGPSKESSLPEPTDSEICEVFFEAIDTLLGDGVDMYRSLRGYMDLFRPLSNPWCEFCPSESASDEDEYAALKGCLFYRIAYVYRNSTILSSTTAFHFSNILQENEGFLEDLFLQPQIRICSIGGGAASDIVGMVLVLEKLASARGLSELDIRVTVVDVDPAWESTCLSVLGCLESFRGGSKGVRTRFVQADLSVPLYPQEAVRAIERAHVVSVVKFLSELSSMACSAHRTVRILNELLHPGSLLFVLDYPVVLRQCGGPQGTLPDSGLLYEEPFQLHVLDLSAVEKNFHHFHQLLEGHVFNTCLKVFVRGFLKAATGRPGRFTTTRRSKCGEWILQRSSYELYEAGFVQRMHQVVGWQLRGILAYLKGQRKVTNDLILVLRDVEKVCHEARSTLDAWEKVTGEVDEVVWKKYVDSKGDSAQLRKKIYSELVVMARGYWKSFYDGTYSGTEMMKDFELEW